MKKSSPLLILLFLAVISAVLTAPKYEHSERTTKILGEKEYLSISIPKEIAQEKKVVRIEAASEVTNATTNGLITANITKVKIASVESISRSSWQ